MHTYHYDEHYHIRKPETAGRITSLIVASSRLYPAHNSPFALFQECDRCVLSLLLWWQDWILIVSRPFMYVLVWGLSRPLPLLSVLLCTSSRVLRPRTMHISATLMACTVQGNEERTHMIPDGLNHTLLFLLPNNKVSPIIVFLDTLYNQSRLSRQFTIPHWLFKMNTPFTIFTWAGGMKSPSHTLAHTKEEVKKKKSSVKKKKTERFYHRKNKIQLTFLLKLSEQNESLIHIICFYHYMLVYK